MVVNISVVLLFDFYLLLGLMSGRHIVVFSIKMLVQSVKVGGSERLFLRPNMGPVQKRLAAASNGFRKQTTEVAVATTLNPISISSTTTTFTISRSSISVHHHLSMASKLKTTAGPATPSTPENSNPNLVSRSPLTIKSATKTMKSASRNPKPNLSEKKEKKKKAVAPFKQKLESKCPSEAQPEEKITAELAADEQVFAETELCAKVEVSESGGRVNSGVCRSNIKRGKVMNLIQAFERILTMPPGSVSEDGIVSFEEQEEDGDDDNGVKQKWPLLEESSEVTQSPVIGTLHLDSGVVSSSWDGSLSKERLFNFTHL